MAADPERSAEQPDGPINLSSPSELIKLLSRSNRPALWVDLDIKITEAMALSEVSGIERDWSGGLSATKKLALFDLVVENDSRKITEILQPEEDRPERIKTPEEMEGDKQADQDTVELMGILGYKPHLRANFRLAILEAMPPEDIEYLLEVDLKFHPFFSKAIEINPEAADVARLYVMQERLTKIIELQNEADREAQLEPDP